MRIGIVGSGNMAAALGEGWARAGHELLIGGRSPQKSAELAARIAQAAGDTAPGRAAGSVPAPRAVSPREAAEQGDAILLAVLWDGVEEALAGAGAGDGALAGKLVLDCSNATEHGVGTLLTAPGSSAAQRVAELAPGAHVVKAFHLFPAAQWASPQEPAATVPLCGDDEGALETAAALVRDVGGVPAVLAGGLARARQLEEAAGFVIGLAFSGANPAAAIPRVEVAAAP